MNPRRPPTTTVGDTLGTILVGALGIVFLILTVLSVPRWWTTKFEFPPPILVTFGLAGLAYFAFLVTRARLGIRVGDGWEQPQIAYVRGGEVTVFEGNVSHRTLLRRLGGKPSFVALGCWSFPAPDEPTLARVLTELRDAGAVFPRDDPKGFTVSDDFIALRERGLVSGKFYQLGDRGELRER